MLCSTRPAADVITLADWGMPNWSVRRYRSGSEVREAWPRPRRPDDFWVSPAVLSFLVDHPQGVETEAVVLEDARDFSQVLLTAQTFSFSAAGQVSDGVKGKTTGYDFRRRMLAPFSFRVLCLGQFLSSGDCGSDGLRRLAPATAARLLPAVAEALMRTDRSYSVYVIKDLYPAGHPTLDLLHEAGHYTLPSDPVMQLDIPEGWRSTEDYLASLSSKYRVRYRRARSKLAGITRRRLSPAEVEARRDELYACYRQVSEGAAVNVTAVRSGYFPWLAGLEQARPVYFHGYFNEEGALIGFTTAIPSGRTLQAHFLGLHNEYKRSHSLYHNMLFDLLDTAIEGGFNCLDYGRTALEIKSSVGATARTYPVLVRARYGWLNRLIPVFTPAVYSAPEWVGRNPFRG